MVMHGRDDRGHVREKAGDRRSKVGFGHDVWIALASILRSCLTCIWRVECQSHGAHQRPLSF